MTASFAQYISLTAFAFGAMAFSVLAAAWWRQRPRGRGLFGAFTFTCAASFLSSLALAVPPLSTLPGLLTMRDFLIAVVPPMMTHLALDREHWNLPGRRVWQTIVGALYLWSLLPTAQPDIELAVTSGVAVLGLMFNRGKPGPHRLWNIGIFALLAVSAVGLHVTENPAFELAPDYLLLLFFAVWLYYSERLAFFDVFLRGGAYFLCGAVLVAVVTTVWPSAGSAFALLGLWLLGPFIHARVAAWVDRAALQRRYAPAEAEREFTLAIQSVGSEEELRAVAESALSDIFRCAASVQFDQPQTAGPDDLMSGDILLRPRPSSIPYLSDDRRLLANISAALGLALQNIRFRQRQGELAAEAARAELRALRAQINPHFLFNALNAIAGWIPTRPDLADDTVAQLAEVFRYALNRSQQEWVRLSEEIDFLRACLAVEKARFGDRLEITIEADERLTRRVQIPVMLLQPLVENATRHGTSHVEGTGRVSLRVAGGDGAVTVTVDDNGPGFPPDFDLASVSSDHHGMRNVADRLRGYYRNDAALRWENTPEGCRVTLHFPETPS